MTKGKTIEKLRKEINEIDSTIVDLLAKRMKTVQAMGAVKLKEKIPIYDAKREEEIHQQAMMQARKRNISEEMIREIYEKIITTSKEAQNHESFKKNQRHS